MEEVLSNVNDAPLEEAELAELNGGAYTQKYIHYKIVRSDTLSHLAHVYHTTVDELVRLNHIKDRNRIYAGDYLWIPVR